MLDEVVNTLDNNRGLRVWARVSTLIIGVLLTAITGLGGYVLHSVNAKLDDAKDGIEHVENLVGDMSKDIAKLDERTQTNERRISAMESGYIYRGAR